MQHGNSRKGFAQAPEYQWSTNYQTVGNTSNNVGMVRSLAVDGDNNTFTAGMSWDTLSFDGGSVVLNHPAPGSEMAYISKHDKDGNFLWAKQFDGIIYFEASEVDAAGNIYLTGHFWGTADFDPGTGNNSSTSMGASDGFILRLDNNGNYLSHNVIPSTGNIYMTSIAVDNAGSVVVAGYYTGGTFLAKYNASLSTNTWNNNYTGTGSIRGVTIGANNDIFVTGYIDGSQGLDFGTQILFYNNSGYSAMFLGKLSSAGSEQWGHMISTYDFSCLAYNIVATSGNDIFITGALGSEGAGTVDFDHLGTNTNADVSAGTAVRNYLLKYDQDGNFEKVFTIPGYVSRHHLAKDAFDDIYVSAAFQAQNVNFDPGTGTYNVSSSQNSDSYYLLKVDSSFGFVGAGTIDFGIRVGGMAISKAGDIFHAGAFAGTRDFDFSSGTQSMTAASATDGYVLKTRLCNISGSINTEVSVSNSTLTATQPGALYQWIDCGNSNAPVQGATGQAFTPATTGNYAAIVMMNGCSDTTACNSVTGTGVANVSGQQLAIAYPNPATDQLVISSLTAGASVTLSNMTGQVLYTNVVSGSTHTIDLNGYADGMYFLRVTLDGIQQTQKIIIRK
jgi:hypothetical protein